jgi:hypothetical protein
MKKTILILFALVSIAAMADTVFTNMPDTIISAINIHTDSVVTAAQDTLITTAQETTEAVGWGWKIIAGILIAAEVVLRLIPTKASGTLLGLVSWLHSILPNNVKKKKEDTPA